jgi:hypothetical protein
MIEPRIEPGTSWLVVRSSDHQATRLVSIVIIHELKIEPASTLFMLVILAVNFVACIQPARTNARRPPGAERLDELLCAQSL